MAVLAQLVEHWIVIPRVTGSIPVHRPSYIKPRREFLCGVFYAGLRGNKYAILQMVYLKNRINIGFQTGVF